MLYDKMFTQTNILESALQASLVRNDVIVNNIANNDVPGFKAKRVDFEESLKKALEKRKQTGNLDLSNVKATVKYTHENFKYRIDENNVDVETEMVNLYQNSVKYDTMISSLQSNSKRMSLAIMGR